MILLASRLASSRSAKVFLLSAGSGHVADGVIHLVTVANVVNLDCRMSFFTLIGNSDSASDCETFRIISASCMSLHAVIAAITISR